MTHEAEQHREPSERATRSPRESPATRPRGEKRAPRHARLALIVLILAGTGAGVYLWLPRFQGTPDVVVVKDVEVLEPQVRAHLEEQIEWVRQAPHKASRHATLGIAYAANSRWLESADSFRAALKLDPGEMLAKYHLAVAMHEVGDYSTAIAMLEKTVGEHPDFAPACHRLGVLLLETGSVDAAESALQQAVALAPNSPEGYIGLAEIALQTHDSERAIELLEQVLKLAPRNRMAHYLLGTAYRHMGQRADAERELRRGAGAVRKYMPTAWSRKMEDHAKLMHVQIDRAQRLAGNGQFDKAIEILETVLQWHPETVSALNELAVVHMRLKQPANARELLLKAMQLDQTYMGTYINLAAYHYEVGELNEALRYVDRAIELAPTTSQAHITRANTLLKLRRPAEAAEAQETAVQLDPQNPVVHMRLAHIYAILGRYADAKDQYEIVLTDVPRSVHVQVSLCEVCIRLGDLDRAAAALAAAQRLAPDHPRVRAMASRLKAITDR